MILRGAVAALLLCSVAVNPCAATEQDEIEAEFRLAMLEARSGQTRNAIQRLEILSAKTPAPRIRLELARLLMRSQAYVEAGELFRQVYREPETPHSVKRNILPFIEEAELRVLRIRYGARVVSDSNPSKVSEGGTVYFNGVPLEYEPPAKKKTSYGIEPWLSAEKLWDSGYLTKMNASARVFEDADLRSGSIQISAAKKISSVPGLFVQAGLDGEIVRDGTYIRPSAEAWKRHKLSETAGIGIGGQLGYMFFENSEISGPFYRGYVFGDWTVSQSATVFSRLSVETLNSQTNYYDYISTKLDFGIDLDVRGVSITPKLSWKQTVFPEFNPFWGLKRKDSTIRPELTLSAAALEWDGIRPEFSVFYEKRKSNVDIYQYDQIGGYVNLKKMF